jgi:uncharacterized protein YlaI
MGNNNQTKPNKNAKPQTCPNCVKRAAWKQKQQQQHSAFQPPTHQSVNFKFKTVKFY